MDGRPAIEGRAGEAIDGLEETLRLSSPPCRCFRASAIVHDASGAEPAETLAVPEADDQAAGGEVGQEPAITPLGTDNRSGPGR